MAAISEQYKTALEIIIKEKGELSDDTYLDKLLDCTKENLSSTSQLQEWGILSFVKTALSEPNPDALKAFSLRLIRCSVGCFPQQSLPLLQLVPRSIFGPNQETGLLFAAADFLCQVFDAKSDTEDIVLFAIQVNVWDNFLKPIMVGNVGKSFHLTKVIENLAVSLIKLLGRALELKCNTEVVSTIDGIMSDLLIPPETSKDMSCCVKPLLRILQQVEIKTTLLKLERSRELTNKLTRMIQSRTTTLSPNLKYSEVKDILELLVYLTEDFDSLTEQFKTIFNSGDSPDSVVKAAIFVALKHHKRFKNLGTFFLDKVDQGENLSYAVFTLSVFNALELFKSDDICDKVLQVFALCEIDGDGKDLTGGIEENLYRNILMFLKNCLDCDSSSSNSSILALKDPLLRVLLRFLGVSDSLKSDILVFLSAAMKKTKDCKNLSQTIHVVLRHASSSSWDIKDSALSCIGSILSNHNLAKIIDREDCLNIINVLQVAKKDGNSFIRAAAFRTFAILVESIGVDDLDQEKLIDDLRICLDTDTEAIARRDAVKLVQTFYLRRLKVGDEDENIEAVEKLMINALFDFDWEVKVNVIKFWKASVSLVINQSCDDSSEGEHGDVLKELADHGCLTAVVVAVKDYEDIVAVEAEEMVEIIKQFIRPEGEAKRRKIEDSAEVKICDEEREDVEEGYSSDVDDVIDDIVKRKDEDLLKDLIEEGSVAGGKKEKINVVLKPSVRDISPEMFVSFVGTFDERVAKKDGPCKLSNILNDIIEAARGAGLVDDIDCY